MNLTSILCLKFQSVCFSSVCRSYMIGCWSNLFPFFKADKNEAHVLKQRSWFRWQPEVKRRSVEDAKRCAKGSAADFCCFGCQWWNVVECREASGSIWKKCLFLQQGYSCLPLFGVCWSVEFLLLQEFSFHHTSKCFGVYFIGDPGLCSAMQSMMRKTKKLMWCLEAIIHRGCWLPTVVGCCWMI